MSSFKQSIQKGVLTEKLLDIAVDGKLARCEATNHEQTGRETRERSTHTKLLADLDQSRDGTLARQALGLVDLRQHGVRGLGHDGSGETAEQTGSQVHGGRGTGGHLGLVELA